MASRTWWTIVYEAICKIAEPGGYFNIKDFEQFRDAMQLEKPDNPFIREKIRQQLQLLRDRGFVEFLIPGSYRRLK